MNTEDQLFNICVGVCVRGRMWQTFHVYQKMRKKIPHLLIPMSSLEAVGEIWFLMKTRPKMKITGVEIAWVKAKSNNYR